MQAPVAKRIFASHPIHSSGRKPPAATRRPQAAPEGIFNYLFLLIIFDGLTNRQHAKT